MPKSMSISSTSYLKNEDDRGGSNGQHRLTNSVDIGSCEQHRAFMGMDGVKPEEQKGSGRYDRTTGSRWREHFEDGAQDVQLEHVQDGAVQQVGGDWGVLSDYHSLLGWSIS